MCALVGEDVVGFAEFVRGEWTHRCFVDNSFSSGGRSCDKDEVHLPYTGKESAERGFRIVPGIAPRVPGAAEAIQKDYDVISSESSGVVVWQHWKPKQSSTRHEQVMQPS